MISIVIPTYEMHGRGVEFLCDLVHSICTQHDFTFIRPEVIVSDDSEGHDIETFCKDFSFIQYHRNPGTKGAAHNLTNAVSHAKGDIIKPMFQDDRFLDTDCLAKIAAMTGQWCVCNSAHTSDRGDHVPYDPPSVWELARGCNTYGSPSAVAWRRNDLLFDTNLQWLFDCDFYARMLQTYGKPEYIDSKVLIREWDGMATRTNAMGMVRVIELEYIENKYKTLKPNETIL